VSALSRLIPGMGRIDPAARAAAEARDEQILDERERRRSGETDWREHRRLVHRPRGYTDTPAARAKLAAVLADQAPGGPWHVIVELDDGHLVLTDDPRDPWIARPRPRTASLQPDAVKSDKNLARALRILEDGGKGVPVAVRPDARKAILARLTPAHETIRATVAHVLGVPPYGIEVAPTWAATPGHGGHLDRVVVRGARSLVRDPEKRRQAWVEIVAALPDGHDGWTVDDRGETVVLSWQPPEVLPDLVRLQDAVQDGAPWHRVMLGLDAQGDARGGDLTIGPHALVVGPTGSGKTIALSTHITSALVAGHDVVIAEAVKGAVDFAPLATFCRAVARDIMSARDLVLAAYAEGQRRKALLQERGVVGWQDLPASEHVHPLTLVLDEYASLVLSPPVDKSLPDRVREAQEQEAAARALIRTYVGKIARELRFVGVHLVIAMQRADVTSLGGGSSAGGGELRSNLSSGVQLVKPGSPPSRAALSMLFPDAQQADAAYEALRRLDDGRSRGLALIGTEGGGVRGLRVAYAPARELPGILDAHVVPRDPDPLPIVMPAELAGLDDDAPSKRGRGGDLGDALDAL
jgi:hypothetical protein